jgi:molybdopterin molybdotransferase
MLAVADAQAQVLERVFPGPVVCRPLGVELLGLTLAEHVKAASDSPPFDKAMVDGYAVRSGDAQLPGATLTLIEEIPAGRMPRQTVEQGQASLILTGAPLPAGADAVIMHEKTQRQGQQVVLQAVVRPGQNVLHRGTEMTAGEQVLSAGTTITPAVLGMLASLGAVQVSVYQPPHVAILSTGDELVEPEQTPAAGQIRNANGLLLTSLAAQAGGVPSYLGIARDQLENLSQMIRAGLGADMLLISGGVSAGALDLVPRVLADCGVTVHFHKVAMKPGKPLLFGTRDRTLIFGLPGNPVSCLVGFELFVRPALRRRRGQPRPLPIEVEAELTIDFHHQSDRPTWYPAKLADQGPGRRVTPLGWQGSADLRTLTSADGLMKLPPGPSRLAAGTTVTVHLLRGV